MSQISSTRPRPVVTTSPTSCIHPIHLPHAHAPDPRRRATSCTRARSAENFDHYRPGAGGPTGSRSIPPRRGGLWPFRHGVRGCAEGREGRREKGSEGGSVEVERSTRRSVGLLAARSPAAHTRRNLHRHSQREGTESAGLPAGGLQLVQGGSKPLAQLLVGQLLQRVVGVQVAALLPRFTLAVHPDQSLHGAGCAVDETLTEGAA